jgi:tetratricopeptide (TPR) repeat protein
LEEALTFYDRAIDLQPKSFWAWNNKGWIYARQNQHEAALKLFDKAIEIDRTEGLPWINKGESLRKLGRIDEAVQCLESALAVVSDQRDVLQNLASLFADSKFDDERALECYQQILKINPDDLSIRAGMAEILIKLRRRDGRDLALEVGRVSKDVDLQCVAQYLAVVSKAFERAEMSTEFLKLVQYLKERGAKLVNIADSVNWNFDGLSKTINESDVAPETKFLLLTLIDLQLGKIDSSKLSFFERQTAVVSAAPQFARR